jgi:DNA-binding NtrC family response regulator
MTTDLVLLIDDDPDIHVVVEQSLDGLADVVCVADLTAAAPRLVDSPAVVLIDLELGGDRGDEFVDQVAAESPMSTIIVLSGVRDPSRAVDLMRRGAEDYLVKPVQHFELRRRVERALTRRRLVAEAGTATGPTPGTSPTLDLLRHAESVLMVDLCHQIGKIASSSLSALIVGETGTGKELVARALHEASGAMGPFVTINCGALPRELMEAELFGHTAGAFTGAKSARKGLVREAEGGTLFLDEIGELPLELQPKLLRFLQEREARAIGSDRGYTVQVRVLAATHRDLAQQAQLGTFREDLFFRLRVLQLAVPALRDRRSDIPALAEYFLRLAAATSGRVLRGFEKAALRALVTRDWPGNVRELEHLVQRAAVFADGPLVSLSDMGLGAADGETGYSWPPELLNRPFSEARDTIVEEFERAYVREAMHRAGGNVAQAARASGLPRKSLWRIAQRVGLAADRASRKAGRLESSEEAPPDSPDPLAVARAEYLARTQDTIAALCIQIESPLDLAAWSSIRATAHRLRGSGGSYGFPELSQIAGELEDASGLLDLPKVTSLVGQLSTFAQGA